LRSPARSPTFVLDMGEPIRIVDLARRMIRLAGLEPDVDVAVTFSGLRPGERLSEVLEFGGEDLVPTEIAGIRATDVNLPHEAEIAAGLDRLRAAVSSGREADVLAALDTIIPEYAGRTRVPA
jgi:O-antigen biosynthesis protein WbqV